MARQSASNFYRYIPIRPRDVQWGLYVTGAGCTSIPAGSEYPPPGHPPLYGFTWNNGRTLPEYQAVYIAAGAGEFESAATGPQPLRAGSVFLLFPGAWHRYRPLAKAGWEEYWVSFNGSWMDRLVEHRFFAPDRAVLAIESPSAVLAAYQRLLARLREPSEGFPPLIAADTSEILAAVLAAQAEPAELVAEGPREVVAVKDRLVAEAIRFIWEQGRREVSVEDVVCKLPVTRRSLERRFQAEVGHTILEEIVGCRLDRAARLLRATRLSLKEVARAAGFPSPKAMHHAFVRYAHTTPSEYRRAAAN